MAQSMLKGQESLGRQGLELSQATTHTMLETTAAMTGRDQIADQHQSINEAFSQLKESHAQLFEAIESGFDRSVDGFDQLADEYVQMIDESMDQLLESHRMIEDQSSRNFEEFTEQLQTQLERTQQLQDDLEGQFQQQAERTEELLDRQTEQIEQFQQQLEEEAAQMQEEIESIEIQTPSGEEADGHEHGSKSQVELEIIDGLGETFRERLVDAGIDSVGALLESDPQHVADVAEVSEERAEEWIEQASG